MIAPADGRILNTSISDVPPEIVLPKGEWRCISIFMNVFDVHVNRSPLSGVVCSKNYVKGKFVNASLNKANIHNERLALVLDTGMKQAPKIGFVQIAGLVARRILCDADVGDRLAAGQIYGLIRFGSRVDVWLPAAVEPQVRRTEVDCWRNSVGPIARSNGKTFTSEGKGMTADRPDQPKESSEKRRFRSASLNWLLPNMLDNCRAYFWIDRVAFCT